MDFTHQEKATFWNEIILQLKWEFKIKQKRRYQSFKNEKHKWVSQNILLNTIKGKKMQENSKNTTLVQLGRASLKKWQCCWKQKDVQVLAGEDRRERGRVPGERAETVWAGGKRREQEVWSGTEGGRWDGRMVRDAWMGAGTARLPHPAALWAECAGPPVWGELVPRGSDTIYSVF